MSAILRLLLLAAPLSVAAALCTDDASCSYNGQCSPATGACLCRPGWKGEGCERLRLGAATPTASIHGERSAWTWGGSPFGPDANGTHHLLFSYITNGCGLLHYQTNSVVRHAVADDAAGPWRVLPGNSLEPRSGFWDSGAIHGPTIVHDPTSQRFLLFYMGTTITGSPRPDCRANRQAPAVMNSSSRRIGLAWSRSITAGEEQWHRVGSDEQGMILGPRAGKWDSGDVSNAAPIVLANGSIMLGYRAGGDTMQPGDAGIGMAFASSWNSSYNRRSGFDTMLFGAEDGALWRDKHSGTFHFLVHNFPNGHNAGNSSVPSAVGGHAFSPDGWRWTYSKVAAYTTELELSGGERRVLYRRERPKPFFDPITGDISGLWNGAWPCHAGSDEDDTEDGALGCETYTMMAPVVRDA